LSSVLTPFAKWFYPIFIGLIWADTVKEYLVRSEDWAFQVVAGCMFTPILLFWFFFGPWRWVDRADLAGGELLLRRRGREMRLALGEVLNVSFGRYNTAPVASIRMRTRGVQGDVHHVLVAGGGWNPFKRNHVIEDLLLRIDRLKRGEEKFG
jgi:hypothetical protein